MIIETEDELLHALKQWIKKHGKLLGLTLLTFIFLSVGWSFVKHQNDTQMAQASVLYEELLKSLHKQDTVNIETLAKRLVDDYKHTPYAKLSALLLSKNLMEAGKKAAAKEQLMWVMEKAELPATRQIARLRLVRIWLSENQEKEALALLNSTDDPGFTPWVHAIKGDIETTSGLKEAARADYQKAIDTWPAHLPGKDLLQLKLKQILPD